MEGSNKVHAGRDLLERIARRHFDCGIVSSRELTDGMANAAYSLELADGQAVVLKIAPTSGAKLMRYERNLMKAEVGAMMRVAEAGGVPVPRIYAYDESEEILPSSYFIMEQLQGYPYNKVREEMTEEQRDKIEHRLGVLSQRINEIRGERFGLYACPAPKDGTWAGTFGALISGVLDDGRDVGAELPASYDEVWQEIERALPALDEVTEPRLVHWDLWPGNVFVRGEEIVGLIDFERAMWGDPLIEYYFGKFGASAAFERGYGRAPSTPGERLRRSLYDFYLDLILKIECSFRGFTDQGHVEWTANNLAEGWERFRKANAQG